MTQSTRESMERSCPNCGMPREDWPNPKGFDNTYCCEACSKGEVCTCPHPVQTPATGRQSTRK